MLDRLKAIPILSAIWIVNAIFHFIHVRSVWKIGECLGTLSHQLMSGRRKIIEKNIEVVSKHEPSVVPSPQLTEAIFQRNVANLACSLKTYGMSPSKLGEFVDIQIDDAFKAAITNKTGAVLCLAHMGNWEILSKVSTLITPEPKKFGAIYRPLDSKAADKYVVEQREKFRCKMFPKTTPMGTLSTFIREGGILGILADQRAGRARKNNRPFFGVDSARSKLPAVLHMRTKAPLFSASVYSTEEGRWNIEISEIPTSGSEEESSDIILQSITKSYERNFTEHLLDVFWLHRYWVKPKKRRSSKLSQTSNST